MRFRPGCAARVRQRGPDGRISMTFEVAYGHAFKAPPRVPMAAQTTVSLDDMRALVRTRQGSS
jgi:malonyl-CoA O-methyltransferase